MTASLHRPPELPAPPAPPVVPPGHAASGAGHGRALFLLLALALSGGCQSVQPWERGTFADYTMRPDRDPLHTAMSEHIHFSREASSGGRGVGGSGCGCN